MALPSVTRRRLVQLTFLILLLLRSRALTLPTSLFHVTRKPNRRSADELAQVLQQVYVDEPDGSKTLLVPYRERVVRKTIRAVPTERFAVDKPYFPLVEQSKPNVDGIFVIQLRAILFRVAIPSWRSSEAGIVAMHSAFLVLRTVLSIMVARLDGRIVRDIVKADGRGFLKGLALWFLLAIPSTFTNSMIRHLQSLLALRLRTRLTRYLHDLYLSANPDLRYYRASNYIEGIDQYLTADVDAWSNAMSGLYGNLLKPTLDLLLFTSQLSRSLGIRGTLLLFVNYYTTVLILRSVTPAFGRLAAVEARLEGEYRAGMGRVGREAEEVAFYDGGKREREGLMGAYGRLVRHVNSIYKIRIAYEWTEDYVIKYLWSAAGYALIAVPILFTRTKRSLGLGSPSSMEEAVAGRTETYISNRRLLLSLADAGGRLMYAYKDLLELAGLTTRLYALLATLLNLPRGYEARRVEVGGTTSVIGEREDGGDVIRLRGVDVRIPRVAKKIGEGEVVGKGKEKEKENVVDDVVDVDERQHQHHSEHKHEHDSEHEHDPPLVKDLNLIIKRGDHLMITGSNGVGKTAVARVLAGLWDPSTSGSSATIGDEEGGGQVQVEMPRDETEAEAFAALSAAAAAASGSSGAASGAERFATGLGRAGLGMTALSGASSSSSGAKNMKHIHPRPRPTLYVLPQRSYMTVGSLLEQIIYPCSYASFVRMALASAAASGGSVETKRPKPSRSFSALFLPSLPNLPSLSSFTNLSSLPSLTSSSSAPTESSSPALTEALSEIHAILTSVHLGYLVQREGGLHVRKEWRDVLSGGEKQRLGMARVLWWRPKWAVLDECTSAVSSDVEGRMYEAAKALDITLITISLRPSLAKYHKQMLTLHGLSPSGDDAPGGPGRWTLTRIGTPEERLSVHNEIRAIEEKLREVGVWEGRVRELEGLLGVQELDLDLEGEGVVAVDSH